MSFSFKALHRSAAYWTVLAVFFCANLWSALQHSAVWPGCCESGHAVGVPFRFFIRGDDVTPAQFFWTGLLLNVVIAWTLAVLVTWIMLGLTSKQTNHPD